MRRLFSNRRIFNSKSLFEQLGFQPAALFSFNPLHQPGPCTIFAAKVGFTSAL
jgi:hypothetical protein